MTERKKHRFSFSRQSVHLPPSRFLNLRSTDGKLFVDPTYGEEQLTSLVLNGISLKGKWEAETEDVGEFDYILRFVDRMNSASISLTFINPEDRIKAVAALESERHVPHVDHTPKSIVLDPLFQRKKLEVVKPLRHSSPPPQKKLALASLGIGVVSLAAAFLLFRHWRKSS